MFSLRRRIRALLTCALCALAAACVGDIAGQRGAQATGDDTFAGPGGSGATGNQGGAGVGGLPAGGAAGKSGAGPVVDPVEAACSSAAPDPGPAYIRRLSRYEFNNTVRDLLGDKTQPARDFPTEERKLGFDNNATAVTVSPLLSEQYLIAADTLATAAVEANLLSLVGCDPTKDPGGEDACARSFVTNFGKRAYRRQLSTDEIAVLNDVYAAGKTSADYKAAIRMVLTTMLLSPRFLYRVEFGVPARAGETVVRLDPWETASRLSYLLWGSMPDAALFNAASMGKLSTVDDIRVQAERMLTDKKAREVMLRFNEQWLELEHLEDAQKDLTVYPKFNKAVLPLMREETSRFLDTVIWDAEGDLPSLFTAQYTFLDPGLAAHYGLPAPPAQVMPPAGSMKMSSFQKMATDGVKRAGLLTQGSFMTSLSKANQTSPIYRGKFVREQLLCQPLPPPPNDIVIVPPALDKNLTTRERFTAHRADPACAGCHNLMDPVGLGFENFDGTGVWRDNENGKPVNASGELNATKNPAKFNGAVDLGKKLAGMEEVRDCFAIQWFHYGFGRGESTRDACSVAMLKQRFAAGGYKIKNLLLAMVQSDAFLYRPVVVGGTP